LLAVVKTERIAALETPLGTDMHDSKVRNKKPASRQVWEYSYRVIRDRSHQPFGKFQGDSMPISFKNKLHASAVKSAIIEAAIGKNLDA
jgi:hypothetical protein